MAGKTEFEWSRLSPPQTCWCLGITGHRDSNAAFAANRAGIAAALDHLFSALVLHHQPAPLRLHSLLAQGVDLLAVELAIKHQMQVTAPLPFGATLNAVINAHPETLADAQALLTGTGDCNAGVRAQAEHILSMARKVRLFELAEQDDALTALFLRSLEAPDDVSALQAYTVAGSQRAQMAGQVMIEQSDLLIAVWDGETLGSVGGTRQTMLASLSVATPVLWIDARNPDQCRWLTSAESLLAPPDAFSLYDPAALARLVDAILPARRPDSSGMGPETFHAENWRRQSNPLFHAYRRVEALFGGRASGSRLGSLRQRYELPSDIATGSGAALLAQAAQLPGSDPTFTQSIASSLFPRFAWADGLSTFLSDAYRGGMVANFILSALAVIGGIAYLPFVSSGGKWAFALFEFVLLLGIVVITVRGRRGRWHSRWFETRRVAEYLRHAPALMLLGVARPVGRWSHSATSNWPETYARDSLRELGLPQIRVTQAYLRAGLQLLLDRHVVGQRHYHHQKAKRLTATHHNLDRLSELMFLSAIIAVAGYLGVTLASHLHMLRPGLGYDLSKSFTFLGVLLPTLGGASASIRFFGDFERFAAISEITATKLASVEVRISTLLDATDAALDYATVADIAHEVDAIVMAEIESWQAVFGSKVMTVPV